MILFVQEVPFGSTGVGVNCERKFQLLGQLDADTRRLSLAPQGSVARELLAYLRAASILAFRRPILYARFNARSVPLAWLAARLSLPVVLEVNGEILNDMRHSMAARAIQFIVGRLVEDSRVSFCGDLGHSNYCSTLWPSMHWNILPLGVAAQSRPTTAPVEFGFLFTGSFNRMQGINEMAHAYGLLCESMSATPDFHFFGGGPVDPGGSHIRAGRIIQHPAIPADGVPGLLERALVLVAAGPLVREPSHISMLKVAEYLQSSRPVVVPHLDSLVVESGLSEEDGVFTWDGRTVQGLKVAMARALEVAVNGTSFPHRFELVQELRGPEGQLKALRRVLHQTPKRQLRHS